MIALVAIVTIWIGLLVLIVGACRAARLGDRAQQEPLPPPTSPRPVPQIVARRRFREPTRPRRLHAPHDLSAR